MEKRPSVDDISFFLCVSILENLVEAQISLIRATSEISAKKGSLQEAQARLEIKEESLKDVDEVLCRLQNETGIDERELRAIEALMSSDEVDEFDDDEGTDVDSQDEVGDDYGAGAEMDHDANGNRVSQSNAQCTFLILS